MKNKNRLHFLGSIFIIMFLSAAVYAFGRKADYWNVWLTSPFGHNPFSPIFDLVTSVVYGLIVLLLIYKLPKWWSIAVGLYAFGYSVLVIENWIPLGLYNKFHIMFSNWLLADFLAWAVLAMLAGIVTYGLYRWLSTEKPSKPAKSKN